MWVLVASIAVVLLAGAVTAGYHFGKGHSGRHHHEGRHGRHGSGRHHKGKGDLAHRIYHVTEADSLQKKKMQPGIEHTSKSLEALQQEYLNKQKQVLDSLSQELKPFLTDAQRKQLAEWRERGAKEKSGYKR